METPQSATFRWVWSLISGLLFFAMNATGVCMARRMALEVNGIELTGLWYAFALFPPGLTVLLTILLPKTHRAWHHDLLFNVLNATLLASLVHIPAMYILGGFD